jgi:hypothetical protein
MATRSRPSAKTDGYSPDFKTPTDIPGVFRHSKDGGLRDEHGVLVSFINLKKRDDKRFEEALGTPADTPLDLMLGVMKDPRMPLAIRFDAARNAAPYVHRKMPLAIEAEGTGGTVLNFDMVKLSKMSKEKREQLLATLKELGVKL